MKLASVVLDIPTQALDGVFTYGIPSALEDAAQVGCAVQLEFGRNHAIGFIVDLQDCETADHYSVFGQNIDAAKLKNIIDIVSKPFFGPEAYACAQYISYRYIAPLSSCVRLFTPPQAVPKLQRIAGTWQVIAPDVNQVDERYVLPGPAFERFKPRKGAYKQEAVLSALKNGDIKASELSAEYGSLTSTLKALEAKGAIVVEQRRRMRNVAVNNRDFKVADSANRHELTHDQVSALSCIHKAYEAAAGEVVLVDGVTGSGKTEVYLRAIENVLSQGKNACVLVPEISLTPQTVARFRGRFGDLVAVMHSRMSPGERYDQWDFIQSGQARVVVGARSALFTPLQNIGMYIIDEEHESSYKQDSAPRYHARDVAQWLAKTNNACLVLGSATPSLESLYACQTKNDWHRVCLHERANGKEMPKIQAVDMAREFSVGHRSMFSRPLQEALKTELAAGHKAVLLLNQRGFAKFLLCRDCGYVPSCEQCSCSLTYHEQGGFLMCHHCNHTEPAPNVCPECGSPYLRMFGTGTQRVEAELKKLIASFEGDTAQACVVRMDADTTKEKFGHQKLLEQFAAPGPAVLLGTQMIAKGLDFDEVTLVGVVNADTMLRLPDFRADERSFNLIEQVAGRAGRAHLSGKVIVQSYDPKTSAIRLASSYSRDEFVEEQLAKRQLFDFPPYRRLAHILLWSENEEELKSEAAKLYSDLCSHLFNAAPGTLLYFEAAAASSVSLTEPTPCVLERLKGNYRWRMVFSCPEDEEPADYLGAFFRNRKTVKNVRVSVDVDPQSLL